MNTDTTYNDPSAVRSDHKTKWVRVRPKYSWHMWVWLLATVPFFVALIVAQEHEIDWLMFGSWVFFGVWVLWLIVFAAAGKMEPRYARVGE